MSCVISESLISINSWAYTFVINYASRGKDGFSFCNIIAKALQMLIQMLHILILGKVAPKFV